MLIVKLDENQFFVDNLTRSYPHPNAEYWLTIKDNNADLAVKLRLKIAFKLTIF